MLMSSKLPFIQLITFFAVSILVYLKLLHFYWCFLFHFTFGRIKREIKTKNQWIFIWNFCLLVVSVFDLFVSHSQNAVVQYTRDAIKAKNNFPTKTFDEKLYRNYALNGSKRLRERKREIETISCICIVTAVDIRFIFFASLSVCFVLDFFFHFVCLCWHPTQLWFRLGSIAHKVMSATRN